MTFRETPKGNAGPSVLKKLRAEYINIWSREWPHTDADLSELWFEEKQACGATMGQKKGADVDLAYQETLVRMREDHPF